MAVEYKVAIKRLDNDEVDKFIPLEGYVPKSKALRVQRGVSINLDHGSYYTELIPDNIMEHNALELLEEEDNE